jgi:DNA-binding NtrC family response regulator
VDQAVQPKLLTVIEEMRFRRLGEVRDLLVDVRIVAATHRNLRQMVSDGQFREDLLYRLAVVEVEVPSLRERPEDIPVLVERFLEEANAQRTEVGLGKVSLDAEAMTLLQAHSFPGNVRELHNVIERTALLAREPVIGRKDLMLDLLGGSRHPALTINCQIPYKEAKARLLERFERHYLAILMEEEGGNLSRASRRAGLARQHLRTLCRRYDIPVGADLRMEDTTEPEFEPGTGEEETP